MQHRGKRTEGGPASPGCRRHNLNFEDCNSTYGLLFVDAVLGLPPYCSITSFATRNSACRCVLQGHGPGHAHQRASGWLKIPVPTNRLQTKRHYKLLSSHHPNQSPEKKKSKQKSFPLFVPQVSFRLNDVVQREVSAVSPYRFFLLHKIRGFFFPFWRKIYGSFECLYL